VFFGCGEKQDPGGSDDDEIRVQLSPEPPSKPDIDRDALP
jgi:hypothetical protein